MNALQKRQLAKMAYRDIKEVIDKLELASGPYPDLKILCHWDGCITVDDTLFHEHQLREYEED